MRIIRVFSRPKDVTKQTEIAEFRWYDVDIAAAYYNSRKAESYWKSVWWEGADVFPNAAPKFRARSAELS